MGVPLQLLLGVLLAISLLSSHAKSIHSRPARDTVFPLQLSNQNGSEKINNRDINKIKVEPPKTEIAQDLDNSKSKKDVNNYNSNDNSANTRYNNNKVGLTNVNSQEANDNVPATQLEHVVEDKNETTKEINGERAKKINDVEKEIDKLETGRSIDSDTSKFWSSDFHNKDNVFTLSSSGDNQKLYHDNGDESLLEPTFPSTTFSVSFEIHSKLTTPKSHFFDKKYKEALDSIEQNLESDDIEEETDNNGDTDDNISDFKPDEWIKDRKNGTFEYVKTKSIINNKTADKNSQHKDVDVEETKNVSFEKVYNDTTIYDSTLEQPTDGITTQKVEMGASSTTNKIYTKSEADKSIYILNNKIESETGKPVTPEWTTSTFKNVDLNSTTLKNILLEPIEHNIIPLQLSDADKDQKGSFSASKLAVARLTEAPIQRMTSRVSDSKSKIGISKSSTENIEIDDKINLSVVKTTENSSTDKIVIDVLNKSDSHESSTLKLVSFSTEAIETTTNTPSQNYFLNNENNTTDDENITTTDNDKITTTELSTLNDKTTITISRENDSRGLKSLKTITDAQDNKSQTNVELENTEPLVTTSDNTIETTTNFNIDVEKETTESTELTTFENVRTTKKETLNKENDRTVSVQTTTQNWSTTNNAHEDTTTNQPTTFTEYKNITEFTTTNDVSTTTNLPIKNAFENVIENITEPQKITSFAETITEHLTEPNQTQDNESEPTTTEAVFVNVTTQDENHTTIVPDITSPNLNLSTYQSVNREPKLGNITFKTVVDVQKENVINLTEFSETTVEGGTESTPSEELTKDGGSKKSTIAAIAISLVGAICLVLLGVLLYVMRKRQKRFNYGPRCTPVSLDEYSIDNLSVYNSVRRKGNARTSKRSFGNPAFEDPSGVTHPLNFPALSKFSTNTDDINAEFEDVPQIHARTSELPEGCDSKNRYANVIPLPETRVHLKLVEGVPNSDYINANYVTGPKSIRGYYIATQGPMQNTVDDFWRMIWEQQVKVILMITHLVENGLEKCVDYLPESEVVDIHRLFGDFQVTLKKREVKDKYIISSLQLKNMVSNSWREVTHFWYLGWPEKGVPNEANSLIAFLIEARSYMKTATLDKRNDPNSNFQNGGPSSEHNPVVVHCSPGTGRTGVVIACDIAIREFETTRLVDIPKIVYRIRRDRANSVQSKEQYQFIYKVVSLYATKLTGGQFLKE